METEEDKLSGYKVSLFLLFYGGWGLKWFSCGLSRLEHAMYLGWVRIPDPPVSTAQALRSQVCATMQSLPGTGAQDHVPRRKHSTTEPHPWSPLYVLRSCKPAIPKANSNEYLFLVPESCLVGSFSGSWMFRTVAGLPSSPKASQSSAWGPLERQKEEEKTPHLTPFPAITKE